jgi:hypothetical protein
LALFLLSSVSTKVMNAGHCAGGIVCQPSLLTVVLPPLWTLMPK